MMYRQNCIRYKNCKNYFHNLEPALDFDCEFCPLFVSSEKQTELIQMETKRFFESEYVNVEAVRKAEKKTAKILNAGIPETTQYGERFVLTVQFAEDVRKYAPNKVSWQNIADKWGTISENWIEKVIKYEIEIDRKNNRERIVAYPVDTTPKTEEIKEGNKSLFPY